MIKLNDRSLSRKALDLLAVQQAKIDVETDYAAQVSTAKQLWKPKKPFDEITTSLIAMCPGTRRCCYCEDARGDDIEHFRPKDLYPEYTFDWKNYLLACSACNSNAKRQRFSVIDAHNQVYDVTRKRNAAVVPPIVGDPALINPRYEDPFHFLQIDLLITFSIKPRSNLSTRDWDRADTTIALLQLNTRSELLQWRREAFNHFIGWVDSYRRYVVENDLRVLEKHQQSLKRFNHFSVWEEMKRLYRERTHRDWAYLTATYPHARQIDAVFSQIPEALAFGN